MQLENTNYSKEFLNSLIAILNIKKAESSEDEVNEIAKYIFILENRIISEYKNIEIEIEDNILDREDITIETSEFVNGTLSLFMQIDGFLKDNQLVSYENNHKLKFNGFDEHNDISEMFGAVDYAEYLIIYEYKFLIFKDIFREGTSSDTHRYIEALKFFENKEVNSDSIIEFANQNK